MKRLSALLLGLYVVGSAVGCCCCRNKCHNNCAPACAPAQSPCGPCNSYPNVYGPAPTDAPVFPQTGALPAGVGPVAYGEPIILNGPTQTAQGHMIAPF